MEGKIQLDFFFEGQTLIHTLTKSDLENAAQEQLAQFDQLLQRVNKKIKSDTNIKRKYIKVELIGDVSRLSLL